MRLVVVLDEHDARGGDLGVVGAKVGRVLDGEGGEPEVLELTVDLDFLVNHLHDTWCV